jgi:hypothetical protein
MDLNQMIRGTHLIMQGVILRLSGLLEPAFVITNEEGKPEKFVGDPTKDMHDKQEEYKQ